LIVAVPIARRICRMDFCTASRNARFAFSHQVPPIGDLCRVWQRRGRRQRVVATAVAGDDFDLPLVGEPGLRCRRFAVGQQGDRLAPLDRK
jgi:hypothetical protein